ncbi:hexose carrier protein [Aspergillus saccharolyticus JOP 1030-1]|uniref:Hexose carrier protein n=1 Tax=Aspergillus saccharolyticus JOP 1030-1 TaxID=1450539 RepID=A0A319AT95_9EURO|nr:hexose carrier protein [Aspergillus saccharolyticus JOP 1030-1]PYH49442.1 hexose carrier protein [Aspergillus saccharolyticus JOP 1030-1]
MAPSRVQAKGLTGRALHQVQIALIVAPAFVCFGYNQSGVGPLATLQSWVHTFPAIDTINTTGDLKSHQSTRQGAVVASFQIGALLGALSCMLIGDRFGRRRTVFLGSILTLIGQVLQVSASQLVQMVIGRLILGAGVGQFSVAVPVWLAECSEAKNRGQHVILTGVFMCLGYALCNWIDFAFTFMPYSTLQWRIPLALSFLPSVMVAGSVFCLPESPRWLISVNRTSEAVAALAAYKGLDPDDEAIAAEISGVQSALETSVRQVSLLGVLFNRGDDPDRLRYRFLLCFFLQFFQQMCGGNLISVYVSTIFAENLHMSAALAKILAACALTWKFFCCFIAFYCIDRLGRRTVFIISGTGMCVCMTVMAITSSFPSTNQGASITAATFIFLFNFFYPIGFLGGNFLYCTEVAPIHLRTAMSAVSTANHWLWNFVVVMVTPVALDTLGYRYYVMYAVISACIPISVALFYPETMNRNLELLDHAFRDAPTPWQIVSMARSLPQGEVTEAELYQRDQLKEQSEGSFEQKEHV